jgi:nitrogen fixation NifU-like protein
MNYNKKVMKLFMNPKNMGEIKNPDGVGEVGNPTCGDIMKVYIKVGRNKNKMDFIKDVKFKTFGCAAAIATSSKITELAKGKTLKDVENINFKEVINSLGGLPPIKVHCSHLAEKALKLALKDYTHKNK